MTESQSTGNAQTSTDINERAPVLLTLSAQPPSAFYEGPGPTIQDSSAGRDGYASDRPGIASLRVKKALPCLYDVGRSASDCALRQPVFWVNSRTPAWVA